MVVSTPPTDIIYGVSPMGESFPYYSNDYGIMYAVLLGLNF